MKNKIFNRDAIKAGHLLVVERTDTGEKFNMTVLPSNHTGALGCCGDDRWWNLRAFDRDTLEYTGNKIVEIYGYTANKHLLDNSTEDRELLWSRPVEPKKMTVEEICDALGYEVEIVK